MVDLEDLEVQLQDLKNAYQNLINGLNDLEGVEGLDEQFIELDRIIQDVDNQRIELEARIEFLEEEAYMQENKEQWKKEQRDQDYQYWQSQF